MNKEAFLVGYTILQKNSEDTLGDFVKTLPNYRESGRQSMALNSPSLAYKAVHGEEPDTFIPGRGNHPQKLWKGIPVDEDMSEEVLDRLDAIQEIEGRASCSSHEDAIHPTYYVFRMNTSDEDADKAAKKLRDYGLHALSDVGTRGRPRIVVADNSKPGDEGWEKWWDDLPTHIQKALKELQISAKEQDE